VNSEAFSQKLSEAKTIVTIGTFDGVHIGHQTIIKDVVRLASQLALDSTVLTLFPHPRMVLDTDKSIKLLNTIEERTAILKGLGIAHVAIKTFSKEFSELTAEAYVKTILVEELNAKMVVIGYDHRFGKNRSGNIDTLKKFGKELGFEVKEIKAQQVSDVAVSSTKIRNALAAGAVETANSYLGYQYHFSGRVIPGDKIGRTLGYPTANIQVNADYKLIPKDGVYIVKAQIDGSFFYGMMNIGHNPTIAHKKPSTEVHFFNLNADLYGKTLTVYFLKRLRDELKFASVTDLKKQLHLDKSNAMTYLKLP